jgi:hypothetical protein
MQKLHVCRTTVNSGLIDSRLMTQGAVPLNHFSVTSGLAASAHNSDPNNLGTVIAPCSTVGRSHSESATALAVAPLISGAHSSPEVMLGRGLQPSTTCSRERGQPVAGHSLQDTSGPINKRLHKKPRSWSGSFGLCTQSRGASPTPLRLTTDGLHGSPTGGLANGRGGSQHRGNGSTATMASEAGFTAQDTVPMGMQSMRIESWPVSPVPPSIGSDVWKSAVMHQMELQKQLQEQLQVCARRATPG